MWLLAGLTTRRGKRSWIHLHPSAVSFAAAEPSAARVGLGTKKKAGLLQKARDDGVAFYRFNILAVFEILKKIFPIDVVKY